MNLQQKQKQMEELTRERMAFLGRQSDAQIKLEKTKQRVALLSLAADLIKASGEDSSAELAIEWAKKLAEFVDA